MTSQVGTNESMAGMLGSRQPAGIVILPEAPAITSPRRRRWAFWHRKQVTAADAAEARFVRDMNDAVFQHNVEQKKRQMDIAMVDMPLNPFDAIGRW